MLTEKEPPNSESSPESPKIVQSSFVNFMDQNRELLRRHTRLTHDLRDEEIGWMISPTMESLVQFRLNLGLKNISAISSKKLEQVTRQIRQEVFDIVFGNQETSDAVNKSIDSRGFAYAGKMNTSATAIQSQDPANESQDSVDEVKKNFKEARGPIARELNESRNEFYQKFEEFLLSDPSSIVSFRDFLTDKDQASRRVEIRPLLISLARSERRSAREGKPSSLKEAAEKWKQEQKQNPNAEIIDQFVVSIKSPKILEWLEFASDHAKGVIQLVENKDVDRLKRISSFLKTISFQSAPQDLKDELASFISSKYINVLQEIRSELEKFHPPSESKKSGLHLSFPLSEEPGKRKHTMPANVADGVDNKTPETEQKEKFPIGILTKEIGKPLGVRFVTDSELKDIIEKSARELNPRDPKIKDDLKKILDNLREDPRGLGAKNLTDSKIIVGDQNRSLSLRSMNPGKRTNLNLSCQESKNLRIVFVIYKDDNGLQTIVLEGIYKHEDYDKKFHS